MKTLLFVIVCLLLIQAIPIPTNNTILKNVFNPERLKVLNEKITIVGVVKKVTSEFDGDYHIQILMPDSDKNLLIKKNYAKQDGCLVVEIVCAHKTIIPMCIGCHNTIPIPQVGDSVSITGPWVYDRVHGWNEIHPVDSLVFLSKPINAIAVAK